MAVKLQKGQKINLKRDGNNDLSRIVVGLGWDPIDSSGNNGGLFSSAKKALFDIDCDAAVLMCQEGKIQAKGDIVSFLNLRHSSGAVRHMGDNLTGAGENDDEQILVELNKIPAKFDKLIFVINVFGAKLKKQHFGMLKNAFIRIVDDNDKEFCRYVLSEGYDGKTAMIFGEISRNEGGWEFNAIGQGTEDGDLNGVAKRYI